MDPFDPPLDTARHLRYWQRCLRTLLPHHYTSMDSSRLSLGFFIICSIDLLTPTTTSSETPKPLLSPTDRANLRRSILSHQHPLGGFVGSPTHTLPPHHQTTDLENANIAGTYFALLLLALLSSPEDADSAFAGVNRAATLRWLRLLQRPGDGSFGEIVYWEPTPHTDDEKKKKKKAVVAGGKDMRYSYLAAAVRWMLRGSDDSDVPPTHPAFVPDIDVPALVAHIRRGQTYDGGFAESAAHESHAGYGYCAVAALALLDRPPLGGANGGGGKMVAAGIPDRGKFVAWLASRQFAWEGAKDEENGDGEDDDDDPETANFRLADLSLTDSASTPDYIGFNGRCNKVADTCYTWWTLGSLAVVLGDTSPISASPTPSTDSANLAAQRRFLLEKTQHLIGGFGKHPGSPPDVGHGCLGLAALATMGDPGLKRLDAALCVSEETVEKIERARAGLLRTADSADGKGMADGGGKSSGQRLVDIAARMGDGRPEWLDALA